jgi:Family of unknown function (DUF6524)
MAKRLEPRRRGYLWQFLRRLLFAEFVLLVTWSPSPLSYVTWVGRVPFGALQAVLGIALLIAHVVAVRMAFLSLDWLGITASLLLLGCVLLAVSHLGLLDLAAAQGQRAFWLFVAGVLVAIGLVWGSLQQRISGERTVLKSPP